MSIYTDIIERHWQEVDKHIKPILCDRCRKAGFAHYGECPQCLRAYADAKEWLETHTFVTHTSFGEYHDSYHNSMKMLPYRLPNERPRGYLGIELEVTFDGEGGYYDEDDEWVEGDTDKDAIVSDFMYATEGLFACAEQDSSLPENDCELSIEFISRPVSLNAWHDKHTIKLLQKGMQVLKEHGAYTRQPSSNGMHIHISNAFFDEKNADTAYQNFDWLFQIFQPEIEKLGGREYTSYCSAKLPRARSNLERSISPLDNIEYTVNAKLKKGGPLPVSDHGAAVTLSGATTEVRVFRSTIDYKEILANIELVWNFAHAARNNDTEGKTLDELLHTKDNVFLDSHIQKVRMRSAKNKNMLDTKAVDKNEISFTIERK